MCILLQFEFAITYKNETAYHLLILNLQHDLNAIAYLWLWWPWSNVKYAAPT